MSSDEHRHSLHLIRTPRDPVRRYAPVGRCIYCGRTEGLTTEHIVPANLGGNLELPAASCKACATITGRIEQTCLRKAFNDVRAALGLRRRKHRDAKAKAIVKIGIDDEIKQVEVDFEETPAYFALPLTDGWPGYVQDKPADWQCPLIKWEYVDGERHNRLYANQGLRHGIDGLGQDVELHPGKFSQMIAKVAHGYAVAEVGHHLGEPFLCDHILSTRGDTDFSYRYISSMMPPGPIEEECIHAISLHRANFDRPDGPNRLTRVWMVRLHMFANLGTPAFFIVVGKRRGLF